ncbi:MAG: hypothetical protein M1344_03420 [Candidatus Thermoplasmatota archaeon]|jgi:hypothetical protein|nr:hypothetical protein [Candidatus Thermoplasmatota archaeon]
MPASLYESLAREYLETEGYLVYNNLKMPNKQEIDIFAYSPKKEAIIGEVKAINPNEKAMEKIASKLDKEVILEFVKESYGVKDFKLVLFCWNMYEHDEPMKKYGKKLGFDDVITYPEIVKTLFENVKKVRDNDRWFYDVNRPNTLLLQIIYDALLNESQYLNKKDFEDSK